MKVASLIFAALLVAVLLSSTLAARRSSLKRLLDEKREKDIKLTPKAEYDAPRRTKYSVTSVEVPDLIKGQDCDAAYDTRSIFQPTNVKWKVTAPAQPSVGEPAQPAASDKPALLVITSSKPKWLFRNLLFNDAASATEENWVLWYSPFRPERKDRKIYLMVHQGEFDTYKAEFEAAVNGMSQTAENLERYSTIVNNVKLVGCEITSPTAALTQNIGFGLNRFCGMAFMKKLGQDKFWMVDDNIVTVGGVKDELTAFENAPDFANMAIMGFKAPGGPNAGDDNALVNTELNLLSMQAVMGDARTKPNAAAGPVAFENGANNHWLEQLYLFNAAKLNDDVGANFRSFSPRFVLSKEDLTFSADLLKKGKTYKLVTGSKIYKVLPKLPAGNDIGFNRDFTAIKAALTQSVQQVKYDGPGFATTGTWTDFAKAHPKIGQFNLKSLETIGGVAYNGPDPKEDWWLTVIKAQEIVMFKCTQKGILPGNDAFDFDNYFKFPNNILGGITMVRLTERR